MAKRVLRAVQRYFITGLIVLSPLIITVSVLWIAFKTVDRGLGRVVEWVIGRQIPGVGTVLALLTVVGVGVFAANVIGRKLIDLGERLLVRIPLVRTIYLSIKQLMGALTTQSRAAFKRVVMIEYPRKGIYSIGFLTHDGVGEVQNKTAEHVVNVFVPTTPNPTSGYFLMVPREDCILLDMTVEEAFKLIVSGGILVPPWTGHKEDTADGG